MKKSSSNINESGTLKTEKVYYKDGKFWFLEGDKWPEYPDWAHPIDAPGFIDVYNRSLTYAIQQAIEFEDQEAVAKLIIGLNPDLNGTVAKEGLYTIPEQEVEKVAVQIPCPDGKEDCEVVHFKGVIRIINQSNLEQGNVLFQGKQESLNSSVPSSLEKQETEHECTGPWDCQCEDMEKQFDEASRKIIQNAPSKTYKLVPVNQENKTLQQCKDEIAKSYGFKNWSIINFYEIGQRLSEVDAPFTEEMIFDEAAELYASQFKGSLQGEDQEEWTLSREKMPDFDGMYYVYGFMHHSCGNVTPFHKIAECKMNQWVKSDVGEQMTYWRSLLDEPVLKSKEL